MKLCAVAEESTESEKEEEKEEEEESVQDTRIRPSPKPAKCQLKGKYCRCLRTIVDAKRYCFSKQKCKACEYRLIGDAWPVVPEYSLAIEYDKLYCLI